MTGRRILVAVALCATSTIVVPAQGPIGGQGLPPTKGVIIKGKAPVSSQLLRVTLPKAQEADLPNGVHLIVLEDRRVPQVTFGIVIPEAGGYFDPANQVGLAGFTSTLMREGTTTKTSLQLSTQLETMAAGVNVVNGPSAPSATIAGQSLTEHFDALMGIVADILLNPSFPEDELARLKQRTRAQLTQQRSSPAFLGNELYVKLLFGDHPSGRLSPTLASLDSVTRADLVAFHRAHYVPDHAVLAVSGDISMAEVRKLFDAKFGAWKKAGTPAPAFANPGPQGAAGVHFIARPNSVQTSFIVGTQGIERSSPDYDVLTVLNRVLGGGPTARLFLSLREDKGYTYGAYSSMSAGLFRGDLRASTDVRAEVTDPALRDLLAELARLRNEPVVESELQTVKRSIVASFALSLEAPEQAIQFAIQRWIYKLPTDYWDRYPERVMAVTAPQIQAAAKHYLDPARLQIVAVANPAAGEVLKNYGTLSTYDTEGTRRAN